MKQTQTKLFNFSDAGLDFSAGSKNLFPDRFKKMLWLGYNVQTVTAIAIAGNQVTFTYGGAHGYVADRVLKVDSGDLSLVNGGEFWIDLVTTNTVTFTLNDAPGSIASGFTTRIAPLGWELVYENAHIHIYKFRHIDDTDMYARLCFQNATTAGNRNCIAVGIGRTIDLGLGHVTDAVFDLGKCATVAASTANLKWDFTNSTARTFDNYTYAQGADTFGNGVVVGSMYHIAIMTNIGAYTTCGYTQGIFPASLAMGYSGINYPVLLCCNNGASTTTANTQQYSALRAYCGSKSVYMEPKAILQTSIASNSFISLDGFNTTAAKPLSIYEASTGQFLGFILGLFQAMYATSDRPNISPSTMPVDTRDVDLSNIVKIQSCSSSVSEHAWFAAPVEEVKVVY
ncbi:hypothetical protein [Acinetobacter variabilis]|uniref:hypothetical protein n=1 Tax=Acinetobacter variabilis TaxID=70346 RepID=UPI003D773E2D